MNLKCCSSRPDLLPTVIVMITQRLDSNFEQTQGLTCDAECDVRTPAEDLINAQRKCLLVKMRKLDRYVTAASVTGEFSC
jgi:hypothetical protein